MSRAIAALAAGLVLLAVALVVVLSGSPLVVARTNAVAADEPILEAKSGSGACQGGESFPSGISAIRLTLVATAGPSVSVHVLSGSHVLAGGATGSGWTSGAVTVPVKPLAQAVAPVRICFALGRSAETVELGGSKTATAAAAASTQGTPLPGRFTVEYMRAGHNSWWSLAPEVARHIGLGRAPAGTWVALLLLLSMGVVLLGASWLAVKELG